MSNHVTVTRHSVAQRDDICHDPAVTFNPLDRFAHLPDDHLFTRREMAEIFKVHPRTITAWAETGGLTPNWTPTGQRRYRLGTVRAWLAAQADRYGA